VIQRSDLPLQWFEPDDAVFSLVGVDALSKLFQDVTVTTDRVCSQPWMGPVYFDELGVCRPDMVGSTRLNCQ